MDVYKLLLRTFLFLLPWQTIWLFRVPLVQGSVWQFGVIGVYATEILLLVAIAIFVGRKRPLRLPTVWWRVLAIATIFFLFLNVAMAPDSLLAIVHLIRVCELLMLWLIITEDRESHNLFYYFIGGLVVAALFGIVQFLAHATFASTILGLSVHDPSVQGTTVVLLKGIRHLRAYGPFPHPNIFGGYMAIGFVLLLFFWKWWILPKKVHIMCSVLLLAGLLVSFSRSAWLVGSIGTTVFFFSTYKKKSALIFTVLLLTTLGFVGWISRSYIGDRFEITSALEKRSITERFDAYTDAWTLFKNNKWWGQGVDNYTVALHQKNPARPGFALQPVHSIPLLLLVEIGVIGIIFCVVWMCGFVYPRGRRLIYILSTLFVIIPLLIFDHYLWTLYAGLMLAGLWFSFFWMFHSRNFPT